ncbi:hypothetical protein MHU86_8705 [Fragilaria crotonensis]|nr:hypothetical protein MHU86_8705 [Fragilaria crotonensis]
MSQTRIFSNETKTKRRLATAFAIMERSQDSMHTISELPSSSDDLVITPLRDRSCETKNVCFSVVSVRLHDVLCTGLVNHGPGIGLDWFSTDDEPVSIKEYEQNRPMRRTSKTLRLSALQRKRLLMEKHGYRINDLHRIYNPYNNTRAVGGPQRKKCKLPQRRHLSKSISPALQQLAPAFGQGDMLRTATRMFARVAF